MARLPRGEAEIERLLGLGHLQAITGAADDGEPLLAKAGRTLATATSITGSDPDSAPVLAYDAAWYATTALLAQRGLRPTTAGGHSQRRVHRDQGEPRDPPRDRYRPRAGLFKGPAWKVRMAQAEL